MTKLPVVAAALFAAISFTAIGPANAQNASPQQIQSLIAAGQEQTALADLQPILQAHPDSGVAWYLSAEAQDASGNQAAARTALANAQHDAPGLPFAHQNDVAALQAHLNGGATTVAHHSGISGTMVAVIFLVIVFFGLRMLFRRRRFGGMPQNGYGSGYGQGPGAPPGPYPYGSGPAPGMGGGMGSGIGGSILGGLAAGAGFAAGERVIDDVFGRNNGQQGFPQSGFPDQNSNNGVPDRDDGLNGNPGWDDGSNNNQDDNFDPGNSW